MKTSLLILCASLAVAAAQPGNINFHLVLAKEDTSLYIIKCGLPTPIQFIHYPGQGVWIEQSPSCEPPTELPPTEFELERELEDDVNSVIGDVMGVKYEAKTCKTFLVIIPGSQTKSIANQIHCINGFFNDQK